MRPKKHEATSEGDLFRARAQPDHQHEARAGAAGRQDRLGVDRRRDCAALQRQRAARFESRFVIGLLLLKHMFGLSDEGVCERWVYDPYFQHFTGETFFQHTFPHERSDLSRWRARLGDKLDLLLAESLRVAHDSGALRTGTWRGSPSTPRCSPRNHLPDRRQALAGGDQGPQSPGPLPRLQLRQSSSASPGRRRDGGTLCPRRQFNRHHRQVRFLRTRLGRLIRDIRRKIAGHEPVEAAFEAALAGLPDPLAAPAWLEALFLPRPGGRMHRQGQGRAPWEFGVKVSIVTTNARAPGGQFVLHAAALPGNPYDGHTLRTVLEDTLRLTGREIERVYVDKGISWARRAASAARLHLWSEARCLRHHQTRAAPPIRRRTPHRPHEGRRPPRPLLPQGPCRRCCKRHPHRCRIQLPPHPRLAQDVFAPDPVRLDHWP